MNLMLASVLATHQSARADVIRKGVHVGFVIVRRHQSEWGSAFYACGTNAGMRRTKFHYFGLNDFDDQDLLPKWAQPALVGPWQPHKELAERAEGGQS